MTDNHTPTYVVHEFRVSDRHRLDSALDVFQPGWREQQSSDSGSLAFIADSATFTLGLYDGDQPAAIAWGYRLRLPTGSKSLLIHDIQVVEHLRQQGLGRQLLKAVLHLARQEGQSHIWAVAEASNLAAHGLARGAGGLSSGSQDGDVIYEWRLDSPTNRLTVAAPMVEEPQSEPTPNNGLEPEPEPELEPELEPEPPPYERVEPAYPPAEFAHRDRGDGELQPGDRVRSEPQDRDQLPGELQPGDRVRAEPMDYDEPAIGESPVDNMVDGPINSPASNMVDNMTDSPIDHEAPTGEVPVVE